MNSLKNKIIISMPTMKDYFFEKSIAYISDHGINGATGFILNKKIDTPKFKKLFRTKFLKKYKAKIDKTFLMGGPLHLNKGIIIYESKNKIVDSNPLSENLFYSNNKNALKYLCDKKTILYKVFFGYSAWGKGQLESELRAGDWIIKEMNNDFIFKSNSIEMWKNTLNSISENLGQGGIS